MSVLLDYLEKSVKESEILSSLKELGTNRYIPGKYNDLNAPVFEANETQVLTPLDSKTPSQNNYIIFELPQTGILNNAWFRIDISSTASAASPDYIYHLGIFRFITSIEFYHGSNKYYEISGWTLYDFILNNENLVKWTNKINNSLYNLNIDENTTRTIILPLKLPPYKNESFPANKLCLDAFSQYGFNLRIRINFGSYSDLCTTTGTISLSNAELHINLIYLNEKDTKELTLFKLENDTLIHNTATIDMSSFTTDANGEYSLTVELKELHNKFIQKLSLYVIKTSSLTEATGKGTFTDLFNKIKSISLQDGSKKILEYSLDYTMYYNMLAQDKPYSFLNPFNIHSGTISLNSSIDKIDILFDDEYFENIIALGITTHKLNNFKIKIEFQNLDASTSYSYFIIADYLTIGRFEKSKFVNRD